MNDLTAVFAISAVPGAVTALTYSPFLPIFPKPGRAAKTPALVATT
jgi:hypothetical protein